MPRGKEGKPARKRRALRLVNGAVMSAVAEALAAGRAVGVSPGVNIAAEIAAASADYHVPVGKTRHGTFTVAPFVDYGAYKPFIADTGGNYSSYGVGGYFFINTINLPGVGLILGRNERFMGDFAAFQIGFRFN